MVIDIEINSLEQAVRSGNLILASELVELASVERKIPETDPPLLHLAAQGIHVDMIIYLVNRLPTLLTQKNLLGQTPLHICALRRPRPNQINDYMEMVKVLLHKKIDINVKDLQGHTAKELAEHIRNEVFLRLV